MPFGLRNAAQSFQRFIDDLLRGLSFTYVYIDDILVASSSAEEHASHLRQIFDLFQQHGLQLNVDECIFGVSSLEFLGHHVDKNGITPLLEKLRSPRIADLDAVGAVLHKQMNNQLQPLAFFSQKLQPEQTGYSTFSRELLAIYLTIRHCRHLLEGRDFTVHTDHKPLTYALKAKPDRYSPREVRHPDYISQFTADIRYFQGSDNVVADALSRPDINTLTSDFDLAKLADLQSCDKSIDDLRSTTTLQLRDAPLPASPGTILCDWSTGTPRPVVPLSYRKTVFDHFHSLSHPGIRASPCLEIWTRALEEGFEVDVVYIDFRKAFDTVPHQRLLHKLSAIGIWGDLLNWIRAFLVDRKQRVCIGDDMSEWVNVTSGVPQGSVLGPLLFILYVNDSLQELDCIKIMFSDDVKLWKVIKGPND
nr:unnamed protein product [Spirometra erinaceieuropaei]